MFHLIIDRLIDRGYAVHAIYISGILQAVNRFYIVFVFISFAHFITKGYKTMLRVYVA